MTITSNSVVIRELQGISEYKASEQLQRNVWGEDDPADNADLLLAIAQSGGLVAAAFLGKQMVGLIFGFPTSDPRVQHSHRLAVLKHIQGTGLGTRLKWFQRDWCLQRGIETVRWTYDPLRSANATLNINKLGALSQEYHEDYYGDMNGINAGVPSDRIVAQWSLRSPRVISCAEQVCDSVALDSARERVSIPSDFTALLKSDRDKAYAERIRVREQLTRSFAAGLCITHFNRNTCQYILSAATNS